MSGEFLFQLWSCRKRNPFTQKVPRMSRDLFFNFRPDADPRINDPGGSSQFLRLDLVGPEELPGAYRVDRD